MRRREAKERKGTFWNREERESHERRKKVASEKEQRLTLIEKGDRIKTKTTTKIEIREVERMEAKN